MVITHLSLKNRRSHGCEVRRTFLYDAQRAGSAPVDAHVTIVGAGDGERLPETDADQGPAGLPEKEKAYGQSHWH